MQRSHLQILVNDAAAGSEISRSLGNSCLGTSRILNPAPHSLRRSDSHPLAAAFIVQYSITILVSIRLRIKKQIHVLVLIIRLVCLRAVCNRPLTCLALLRIMCGLYEVDD